MRKIILPPVLLVTCLVATVVADWYLPADHMLRTVWLYGLPTKIGYLLLFIGIFLPIRSAVIFKQEETNIIPYKSPDKMVSRGPFAFTRNPMYLGMLLVLLGVATLYGTVVGLLFSALYFAVANWWYIPFEEAKMANIFGDAFTDYSRRVRRWL
ncbi:MAG: isoprenylcysteine carboxylmethyltransferase family protein [Kordiimonadaceae bacterium]|nr:isoprenylcysteine carboxylmethyltransferase family protein [Kordiimonadaceae bacterium]